MALSQDEVINSKIQLNGLIDKFTRSAEIKAQQEGIHVEEISESMSKLKSAVNDTCEAELEIAKIKDEILNNKNLYSATESLHAEHLERVEDLLKDARQQIEVLDENSAQVASWEAIISELEEERQKLKVIQREMSVAQHQMVQAASMFEEKFAPEMESIHKYHDKVKSQMLGEISFIGASSESKSLSEMGREVAASANKVLTSCASSINSLIQNVQAKISSWISQLSDFYSRLDDIESRMEDLKSNSMTHGPESP